jgi:Protein of unknown function DUF72
VNVIGENVGGVEVVRHALKKMRNPGLGGYLAPNTQLRIGMNPRRSDRGRSRKIATTRFGPAGWLYKDWEGIVYPAEKPKGFDQLRYIADFFDTVEINSSFYGPPVPRTTASWVRRVKDHHQFRFTAKLWKRFTHERDKAWTRAEVDQVRQGFDVMMDAGRATNGWAMS